MQVTSIIKKIEKEFPGVMPKSSWGETALFYNPGKILPNGVYFCTIKEKNGENDQASQLDREDIFRLSIGISKESYQELFGEKPKRPKKGGIIKTTTKYDFTQTNVLMPHPIYGWMSWVQILNPSEKSFEKLLPLIKEAHAQAVNKFNRKTSLV